MKPFKLSKIYTANSDLSKKWFVYYYYQHPISGDLKRFKVKGGVNRYSELETRMDAIEQLQCKINHDLLNGFNPFENNETIIKCNLGKALDYAVEYKRTYLRKRSYQSYFQISKAFKEWLYKVRLYDIQPNQINELHVRQFIEYLKKKGVSNKTANNYLMFLKSLFNFLIDREYLTKNPARKIKKLPTEIGRNLAFTSSQQDQITKYLMENDPYLFLFVQFIYYCFLRPAELRRLRIKDIDIVNNKIIVPASASKNRKLGVIIIPDPFREAIDGLNLDSYPPNHYIFSLHKMPSEHHIGHNYFTARHLKVLRALNISNDHTLYSWKHTGVVRAFEAGINIKDLQIHLRHSSLDMVNNYLKSLGLSASEQLINCFPKL